MSTTNEVLVRVQGVDKVFHRGSEAIHVLSGLNLEVPKGEFLALMGPSGSGKSTLLNLIGGLDEPTSGSVVVYGTSVAGLNEARRSVWRRTQVAFVFQAYHLLPTLTCADNVALPLHLQHVKSSEVGPRVAQALDDVGLGHRARHLPDELSGGERQRTAIARALVTRPRLLLADEPTGNLDTASGGQVLSLLVDLTRARQATMVMVTHNEDAAARCDRIVRLVDGRIAGDVTL
jgi:putative ABC transport system ATP-binding protein